MKKLILFLIMLVFLSTNLYAEDMQRYYFNKVTDDDVINVRQAPNGSIIGQLKYYKPYTKWTLYEFAPTVASSVKWVTPNGIRTMFIKMWTALKTTACLKTLSITSKSDAYSTQKPRLSFFGKAGLFVLYPSVGFCTCYIGKQQ